MVNSSHSCYVVSMNDTKRLLELALRGLEVERTRVQEGIAEIESQIRSRLQTKEQSQAVSSNEKPAIRRVQ